MRIVQVAAEFAPLAKAGGLGEVVVGLTRALNNLHEDVEVIIPKHDLIHPKILENARLEIPDFKCVENGRQIANAAWQIEAEGCKLHLLEARHPSGYFHRGKIYGCDDDVPRFLYFCRMVAEYLKLKNQPIDVLHLHDWHTAALALFIRDLMSLDVKVGKIVLTIHNIEYQGKCAVQDLNAVGLDGVSYLTSTKLQDNDPNYPETINLLKGGIVYADRIVAVSPTYAKEILTQTGGFGLDSTLKFCKSKLSGILNGIDLSLWSPESDRHLKHHFSSTDALASIVKAKRKNKEELIRRFQVSSVATPWVGAVTRIAEQKSPELLEEALVQTMRLGGVFVLLGSSPTPAIQSHFEALKQKYQGHPQVILQLEYDDALAHQIYAALDLLVVPSKTEPCGLTQMIGMHYGVLPIARSTGGLKDTVVDCDNGLKPSAERNGFLFEKATAKEFTETLERAILLYKTNPATFQNLMRCGMHLDFSWTKPAKEYLKAFSASVKMIGFNTVQLSPIMEQNKAATATKPKRPSAPRS